MASRACFSLNRIVRRTHSCWQTDRTALQLGSPDSNRGCGIQSAECDQLHHSPMAASSVVLFVACLGTESARVG